MAHLLVVDDETSARTTLALLLRKRGHRVLEADGVTAATKCLAEEVFDLVVTDLRMPDGDGLDVLRAAKAHAPATEVILLTAYAEWKSAKEAIRLGALDYFEKGQEPDELYHRMGDHAKTDEYRTIATTMYREIDLGFWLAQAAVAFGGSQASSN